jgi:hypothetical protein
MIKYQTYKRTVCSEYIHESWLNIADEDLS